MAFPYPGRDEHNDGGGYRGEYDVVPGLLPLRGLRWQRRKGRNGLQARLSVPNPGWTWCFQRRHLARIRGSYFDANPRCSRQNVLLQRGGLCRRVRAVTVAVRSAGLGSVVRSAERVVSIPPARLAAPDANSPYSGRSCVAGCAIIGLRCLVGGGRAAPMHTRWKCCLLHGDGAVLGNIAVEPAKRSLRVCNAGPFPRDLNGLHGIRGPCY